MAKPRAFVLRAAGTNCDVETAYALEKAGAGADVVHVNRLFDGSASLGAYQVFAIPGGFSYGDDLGAGRILAVELEHRLGDRLRQFVERGGLVIGICNGFQVLVKTSLLPGNPEIEAGAGVTLAENDSQRFEDRWVTLKVEDSRSVWLPARGARRIELPVAHGEGKFVPLSDAVMKALRQSRQVVVRYVNPDGSEAAYPANPNGSVGGVAGISDPTGRVFGLMPHPERHVSRRQHPRWTRGEGSEEGDGLDIFRNAVEALA